MKSNSVSGFASQGQGCGKMRLHLKEVPEHKEHLGAKADHENLSSLSIQGNSEKGLEMGRDAKGVGVNLSRPFRTQCYLKISGLHVDIRLDLTCSANNLVGALSLFPLPFLFSRKTMKSNKHAKGNTTENKKGLV